MSLTPGYFQFACSYVIRCSAVPWVNKTMVRRGWQEWLGSSKGWCSSAQMGTSFSEASWLEGEHGDFSSRGHPGGVNGRILSQLVTLTLAFTAITIVVTDTYTPEQIIQSLSVLGANVL